MTQWTEPHAVFQNEEEKHRVRLFSGMGLGLFASTFIALLGVTWIYDFRLTSRLTLLALVIIICLYGISRTRYALWAINLATVILYPVVFGIMVVNPSTLSTILAFLPIYVSSIFQPLRRVIVNVIVSIGGVIVLTLLVPGDWHDLPQTLIFLIMASLLTGVGMFTRRISDERLRHRTNELLQSQEYFRAATNGSLSAFYLLQPLRDDKGNITDFTIFDVNPMAEKQLVIQRSTIVGSTISQILTGEDYAHFLQQFKRALESNTAIADQLYSSTGRWYDYQIIPLKDGIAMSALDITKRKLADNQRIALAVERERVELLQQFINATSHDLLTPLTIMNTSLYLVRSEDVSPSQEHRLDEIEMQVSRLQSMINEMLEMSRLDRLDGKDLTLQKTDLSLLLRSVVEDYKTVALAKNQRLTLAPVEDLPRLPLDREGIEVALSNLLDNAVKYAPEGGNIVVATRFDENNVIITVKNDGEGIHERDLPYV
ncbi:MAG: PAS domain-containing protein, partial [Anaerolineae bacterium]|nr:PAS domain-containing protein [Anaerolineae bacterium]